MERTAASLSVFESQSARLTSVVPRRRQLIRDVRRHRAYGFPPVHDWDSMVRRWPPFLASSRGCSGQFRYEEAAASPDFLRHARSAGHPWSLARHCSVAWPVRSQLVAGDFAISNHQLGVYYFFDQETCE